MYSGPGSQHERIVIDRDSGELLAIQAMRPDGRPAHAFLIRKVGWTDETPPTR
ncbi:hypothetical protein [Nonomuraea rhizosphaerae]|uniref:hypothetical protein n=1 Tax=Nonomuraea rhizosphaerae TaxID=2665663 RepID=UPI001C5CE33B|nr:hypothetical protein [Nonomuraea rhizosphaerae]